ncbi:MAG TPA: TonB-dependent receptor [Steroidobacteraceae bacterium]|nr:TonB-dependent receptor [Steroidobacteraceae bacterium]
MSRVRDDGRVSTKAAALMTSVFLLGAMQALAQETAERSAEAESTTGTIEEVVVTAQKRAQLLQDVPLAISAISTAQIEERGIDNLLDLKALAPNLMVSKYPNSNVVTQVAIRGGVTINGAMYWEPSTGLYLDGVYLGKAVGSVFDVVDIERIEILRGPQGTLYGRNTMAGAVNFITRAPTGEFQGHASMEVGNYGHHVEKLSIDLPKVGIARMSFGVRSENRDGLVNLTPGSPGTELDSRDKFGARFALGLDFSDNFVADYRFDYTNVDQTPPHSQLYRVIPGASPLFQSAAPFASTDRLATVSTNWPGYEKLKLTGHALTLEWQVNEDNTLKSITSYRDLHNDDSVDLDGTPLTIATANRISDFDQRSQELQWIGHAGRLDYVGGLYYYKDDGYTFNPHVFFFGTDSSQYGFGTEALAAYAQLDFGLTEALTLTAGLRWTDEDKHTLRFKTVTGFGAPIPRVTAEKSFSGTTPMASVSYKVNDGLNVYVRYSEGFKSGGFQGEAGSAAEAVIPYDPEEQVTWEAGAKFASAGGRLQVNTAVFHNDIENMHVNRFTGLPGVSVIRNAGKARTQGAELEAIWLATDALRLQLSYGYLDAKWIEFMEAPAPGQPITNVASNRSFPHAPEHTVSLLADAKFARTAWGELRGMADYSYTSAFFAYPYQLTTVDPTRATAANTEVEGYGLLNLRLTLADIPLGESGTGEFALWSRNVTDEQPPVNFIDFGPGFFANYTLAYYQEPRTYGATFTYRW